MRVALVRYASADLPSETVQSGCAIRKRLPANGQGYSAEQALGLEHCPWMACLDSHLQRHHAAFRPSGLRTSAHAAPELQFASCSHPSPAIGRFALLHTSSIPAVGLPPAYAERLASRIHTLAAFAFRISMSQISHARIERQRKSGQPRAANAYANFRSHTCTLIL